MRTPLRITDRGPNSDEPRFEVNDADGRLIATCARPEDAALIVRAANVHERLVEACERARWFIDPGLSPEHEKEYLMIQAALAAAKEG